MKALVTCEMYKTNMLFSVPVGPLGSPQILVSTQRIATADEVKIRCEAERGTRCHFYTDQSEVPFRSETVREEYKTYQISVFGMELLEDRALQDKAEVLVSCAVELMEDGHNITSQRSEGQKIEVVDTFGSVCVEVSHKHIKKEQNIRIRCESDKGTRCHFYTDPSETPFRSVPYRSNVCQLTVSGRELLAEGAHQGQAGTEIVVSVSCVVELVIERTIIPSQRSNKVTIEVEGKDPLHS
ncbi:uncharacterized protein LOC136758290 [Amia ocellicauda]|uniref:uncharacterized protein LOC136758290 n=1 Tax=Amia ocellicauda TaxID=2972642 RepID=UPI003464A7D2